jgi:hypothetical protein
VLFLASTVSQGSAAFKGENGQIRLLARSKVSEPSPLVLETNNTESSNATTKPPAEPSETEETLPSMAVLSTEPLLSTFCFAVGTLGLSVSMI